MKRALFACALGALTACSSSGKKGLSTRDLPGMSGENAAGTYAVLETGRGPVEVRLFPDEAPKTVENFVSLARKKFYDGTLFHRVIPGFMIHGGDPTGTGEGGPGYFFDDEFHPGRLFSKPGILAMANRGRNTNGSQFFITVSRTPWLDNRHTIFGEVVRGLAIVEAIANAPRDGRDRPSSMEALNSVRIEVR